MHPSKKKKYHESQAEKLKDRMMPDEDDIDLEELPIAQSGRPESQKKFGKKEYFKKLKDKLKK